MTAGAFERSLISSVRFTPSIESVERSPDLLNSPELLQAEGLFIYC